MLKKIELDNYKTFTELTTIDFTATNYKFLADENIGSNKILKGALFVGENASGKTQILKAISFLLDLLFSNSDIDLILNKSFYTKKPNYSLKYYFVIDNTDISYEIQIGNNKIIKEKLYVDEKLLIDRLGNSAEFNYDESKHYDDLSDKLLFLRRIYFDTKFYDDTVMNDWFNFLKNSVYVNCYERKVVGYSNETLLINDYLEEKGVKTINDFFEKIGYNQKIEYSNEIPQNNMFTVKAKDKFISFVKKGTKVYVPEVLESTGNATLINILPSILHATNNDCMIIIDEFSSGFHNELEECLIKYFYHYSKNSQLFFATHSTNILNNTLLRPDQIYSVSFYPTKGTVLKRFSDELPREAQNTEKMYLNGVFDGMPKYNKKF